MVRYYGLYNPVKKGQLELLREGFDQDPIEEPEFLDWQTYCEGRGDDHPERCPVCGKRLICLSVIPNLRNMPPPVETLLKEAA